MRNSCKSSRYLRRFVESLESRTLLSTIYVDADSPTVSGDGTSWSTSFRDLQLALAAATAGDEIRVADGVYKPTGGTDRSVSFQLKTGVAIRGGFAGHGALDPDAHDPAHFISVLSGEINSLASVSDNSYHVVKGIGVDASSILDGFTIAGGYGLGGTGANVQGGGIYLSHGDAAISNCILRANRASQGGAIYIDSSSPALINVQLIENSANEGGGAYARTSTPSFQGCTFLRNVATFAGGGGLETSFSPVSVIRCAFLGNQALNYSFGGGAMTDSGGQFVNCIFVGNRAVDAGGGLYDGFVGSKIINCTFAGNEAGEYGAGYVGGANGFELRNSIVWGNGPYAAFGGPVSHSDIENGYVGTANISLDPQFVRNPSKGPDGVWGTFDDDYGDLRLHAGSPCVDAGNNAAVPVGISTDLGGNPRFVDVPMVNDPGAVADMGAYEYVLPLAAVSGKFDLNASAPAVSVAFNGDLDPTSLNVEDLIVKDAVTGEPIADFIASAVVYDYPTRTASWVFSASRLGGNYRGSIAACAVEDEHGSSLASGYDFEFFVLPGDASGDRIVDLRDLTILATNWQGTGRTFGQGDFDYNGVVNSSDLGILAMNWQRKLDPPPPTSAPASDALRRTPARTPTRVVSLLS